MDEIPRIETERLVLSALTAADIPTIVKHASDARVSEFTLNLPYPYEEKDAIFWINMANRGFVSGDMLIFAIRLKPAEALIGGIGLTVTREFKRAEIGYWLAVPYWRAGYATEAAKALMEFAFTALDLNKLTSSYIADNPASGAVMRKCGMKKEGELREQILKGERYRDLILYGLTRSQFEALQSEA